MPTRHGRQSWSPAASEVASWQQPSRPSRPPPRRAFAGLAAQLEEEAAQAGLAEVVEAVVPDLSSRGVKLHDLAGTDEERSFFYEAASTLNRFNFWTFHIDLDQCGMFLTRQIDFRSQVDPVMDSTSSDFDHAPAQWADNLVGHGDAPVLREVGNPSSSRQDAPGRRKRRQNVGSYATSAIALSVFDEPHSLVCWLVLNSAA
jgi:hypothetical protein